MSIGAEFMAWIMSAPEREWFLFGVMVGMFAMFSILTGYWLISGYFARRMLRWLGSSGNR